MDPPPPAPGGGPPQPQGPLLRLADVRKHFGGVRAVDGVSFEIREGELVGLIGPNGSGKSTLFNVISGVYRPDSGWVVFRGELMSILPPHEIFARGLVRSFQNPRLFQGMTVVENAMVPPRGQKGEHVRYAPIHEVWAEQEVALAQEAVETLDRNQLGPVRLQWSTEVSGGQMKLLEVSRALMAEPRLLLLDEPTAGVAPKLAGEIFDTISALRRDRGLTFLIIEHRLDVLLGAVDRVLVMHEGKLIFDGPPKAAVDDPRVVDAYLGE